jgi:hypothetical protein
MNKLKSNLLLVLALSLGAALLLFGCELTTGKPAESQPSANNPTSSEAGNLGGAAQVSVSDGVILLTPGQPLPTLDISQIITPLPATDTPNPNATDTPGPSPTPAPTADVASLNLPKDLTIYPGATNLDTSGMKGSNGMNSLTFQTKDSPDQVITYYNKNFTQAGWTTSSGPGNTPGPDDRQVWSWTSSSLSVVSLMVTDHPGGGTDVTVTWIAL